MSITRICHRCHGTNYEITLGGARIVCNGCAGKGYIKVEPDKLQTKKKSNPSSENVEC